VRTAFHNQGIRREIQAGNNLRVSYVSNLFWSCTPRMSNSNFWLSSDNGGTHVSFVPMNVRIKDGTFMDRFKTGCKKYLNLKQKVSAKEQLVDPNQDERKQDQKRESVSPTSWLPSAAASSATASASPASAALASLPKVEGTGVNLRPMNINLAKGEKRRARLKAQAKARAKGQPFKRRS
jgi:hypothetical protein